MEPENFDNRWTLHFLQVTSQQKHAFINRNYCPSEILQSYSVYWMGKLQPVLSR